MMELFKQWLDRGAPPEGRNGTEGPVIARDG
jgi:hypothetical protein